jgi:ADP-heptose:LPS heptosyltransferase
MSDADKRVLIIKLSALGDVVQALGPMAAIRAHHAQAHITVLTTKPYADLLTMSGYVDEVWLDERPKWHQFGKCRELRNRLRAGQFDVVYDLQTSNRSSAYFLFFFGKDEPLWSGIARGCSHPHTNIQRNAMHTIDRQAEQLRDAGIAETPFPDLSWAVADLTEFSLIEPYALLVPGGAAHRPRKRWPAENYGALANNLASRGIQPVLLGTAAEAQTLDEIAHACPQVNNLCGRTNITEIAALARGALAAVGNDTGPMHVISLSGAPSIVLYSHESNPGLCAQRGSAVKILRSSKLSEVPFEDVFAALEGLVPDLPDVVVAPTA